MVNYLINLLINCDELVNDDFINQRSYNDFYSCDMIFWSNGERRKYKDVERELARARAKKIWWSKNLKPKFSKKFFRRNLKFDE